MYNILEISKKSEWEEIVSQTEYSAFFQSWDWGDVQKKEGIETGRFVIRTKGKNVAAFQLFTINARRGRYIHVRHGPIFFSFNSQIGKIFLKFVKEYAKKRRASFIRVSPLVQSGSKIEQFLISQKTMSAPIHNVDAENRWILQLNCDEETLLKNMRKTTRYLVRKGEAGDMHYTRSNNILDVKKFTKIYKETANKKNFVPHKQINTEFSVFAESNSAYLYFASKNKRILASALIVYYGGHAIYRHGATSSEGRNTPASYTLQYHAIIDAKKEGQKIYDFWGIAKDENKKNPWYGLTLFKKGFGGEQVDFIHARDIPVSPFYILPYLIDTVTKIRKGH